jgi:hypothetical protein
MHSSRIWIAALAVSAVVGGGVWVWETQLDESRPIDPGPLMEHREQFIAKYRRTDCLARIDFPIVSPWTEALSDQVFRNLMRFVAEERPQTGGFQYRLDPGTGRLFVQFSDDCPNRTAHLRDWATQYGRRHAEPHFSVSDDIIQPGPDALDDPGPDWID